MLLAKQCYDQSYDLPPRAIGRSTGSPWNAALNIKDNHWFSLHQYAVKAVTVTRLHLLKLQKLTPIYNVFTKEYFVDSDKEDDGILFQRRMFVRGQFI